MDRLYSGLREKREKAGISRMDLAFKVGAHYMTVAKWEQGRPVRSDAHWKVLVKLLGEPDEG